MEELGGDLSLRAGDKGQLNGDALVNVPIGDSVAIGVPINFGVLARVPVLVE